MSLNHPHLSKMKDIIILGRGPSWESCPFDTEVWACATCLVTKGMEDKRYDKVFAFDPMDEEIELALKIVKERGIPLISTRGYATYEYPIWEITRAFPGQWLFKPTVSYIMALAIFKGYEQMRLYGVDQLEGIYKEGEKFVQHWLKIAEERGVKWFRAIPEQPGIFWINWTLNQLLPNHIL